MWCGRAWTLVLRFLSVAGTPEGRRAKKQQSYGSSLCSCRVPADSGDLPMAEGTGIQGGIISLYSLIGHSAARITGVVCHNGFMLMIQAVLSCNSGNGQ